MNWISNYVRLRINSISRREVPENLWSKCDECGTMLFHRELFDNLRSRHVRSPHGNHAAGPLGVRCLIYAYRNRGVDANRRSTAFAIKEISRPPPSAIRAKKKPCLW
jgi:hypothetical protein